MSATVEQPGSTLDRRCADGSRPHRPGALLEVDGLEHHAGGRQRLHQVGFTARPGEVVAIVGGSGAGKTTLLEAIVGIRPASGGTVSVDGVPLDRKGPAAAGVGYLPQDDIIHRDLPLGRTLRHAAALRLPAGTPAAVRERRADEILVRLGLDHRRHTRVDHLSGGQRKRASLAVELLTRPRLLLLDEPTSGLDPATAADLLGYLRLVADAGATVVLTTHQPADLSRCDRIVFLAGDGHLAFEGTPADARAWFEVTDIADAYLRLAEVGAPRSWADAFEAHRADGRSATSPKGTPAPPRSNPPVATRPVGAVGQWWALTRRNADLLTRNRLTAAVLVGSPALVVAMMAVLFRPGLFDPAAPSALPAVQVTFWLAFAGFFFGLTYGLLQIVTEQPVFRRERLAGLGTGAYVASKVAVLIPLLVLDAVVMLAVLRALDRLPAVGSGTMASLLATVVLVEMAALTLGLLASAAVADAAQATLALPLICFPQVLFAGAIVPLPEMHGIGRGMSVVLADRWAFEALGRGLGLSGRVDGEPAMAGYAGAFGGSTTEGWLVLAALAVGLGLAAALVLRRRTAPAR